MTTATTDPTAVLRAKLIAKLTRDGVLTSRTWAAAFAATPRHVFAARFAVHNPTTGAFIHHDVDDLDPGRRAVALAAAYSNDSLMTRFDTAGNPISSSTEPSLMAAMLEALDARPGHRVLEIGAGTGYNAALLCDALGEDNVTTIDVEAEFTAAARAALHAAGYHPEVLCGDGAAGVPHRAPFDRIIATCGVDRVPTAWIEQLAPGGAILVNVSKGIVLLCRGQHGEVSGRFLGSAGFMPLRSGDDHTQPSGRWIVEATSGEPERSHVAAVPAEVDFTMAAFFADLVADRSHLIFVHDDDGTLLSYRWIHPASQSWARVEPGHDGLMVISETGPRRLWAELAPVLDSWHAAGRPGIEHYGLTVAADGTHTMWLAGSDWAMTLNSQR